MNEDQPTDSFNPYAASNMPIDDVPELGEYDQVRQQYLNHEASVKSIGSLYLVGGVIGLLGIVAVAVWAAATTGGVGPIELLVVGFLFVVSLLQIVTAVGLRKLAPWSQVAGACLAVVGLFGFPIGTLISAYFLYLLLGKKGNMVFSAHYKDVIEATPHIKYKTSIVVWIFLLLVLGLIGAAILLPLLFG